MPNCSRSSLRSFGKKLPEIHADKMGNNSGRRLINSGADGLATYAAALRGSTMVSRVARSVGSRHRHLNGARSDDDWHV